MNVDVIKDFVETALKKNAQSGMMVGDPVVRLDYAGQIAADAAALALQLASQDIEQAKQAAADDQRQKEGLLSAAAVIYAVGHPNVRPTLEDASLTAWRLKQWVDVHATKPERADDDETGQGHREEGQGQGTDASAEADRHGFADEGCA